MEQYQEDFDVKADTMLARLDDLRKLATDLTSGDLKYWLEQAVTARRLLLTRYAPFKIGDNVRLAVTPVITEDTAPGWLGSRHFLIAGAQGTVRTVFIGKSGLRFEVDFLDESWIDRDGNRHPVDDRHRHVYSFSEAELEAVP